MLYVGLFLLFLVACSAVPDIIYRHLKRNPNNGGSEITGYSARNREKRGAGITGILMGLKAVKTLLQGAKQVPSKTEVRMFQKPGRYSQALDDFYSVKPKHVRDMNMKDGVYGKVGYIGDRTLLVKPTDGLVGAVLQIIKINDLPKSGRKPLTVEDFTVTDVISYINKH